jgi:hypothetical protein
VSDTKTRSPQLDKLIAQSKQITADLMVLRNEVSKTIYRSARAARFGTATSRANLIVDATRELSDEIYEIWAQMAGLRDPIPEPKAPFPRPAPRRIGQEKLFLTGGE